MTGRSERERDPHVILSAASEASGVEGSPARRTPARSGGPKPLAAGGYKVMWEQYSVRWDDDDRALIPANGIPFPNGAPETPFHPSEPNTVLKHHVVEPAGTKL